MSSLPSSSSPSSSDAARRTTPHVALAFLVHSPNTVKNDLPAEVDNRQLARQKRRRTSKEDEEILKAEYLKNPKPNRAVRMEIVTKVALGEKEVQIWFQNKRQNERRRSRPLDSSSSTLMSESSTSSDPATEDDRDVPEKEAETRSEDAPSQPEDTPKPIEPELPERPAGTGTKQHDVEPEVSSKTDSQSTVESNTAVSTDPHTAETAPTELSASQQSLPSSQGTTQGQAHASWISNRRSASFRYTDDYAPEIISFPTLTIPTTDQPAEASASSRNLKRAHSFVRLSMTDEGTARVITDADKTPSPPHARSNPTTFSRAAGIRRSYSAAGLNERLAAASRGEPSPKIPKTGSNIGRSRDSRAWEFWCDPDTRNNRSLTTRADQEGSGSAADAIGLLRANRKVLGQNQARQNVPVLSRNASAVTLGEKGSKKPRGPMQRASTTHGRLQTKESKKGNGSDSDDLPQTESDKENWEPEMPKPNRARQPAGQTNSLRPRQILGENMEIMSQSSSIGAMLAKQSGKGVNTLDRENSDPEQDEELRTFMNGRGLSERTSLSSAEEAGCVEGLLKLSQGNWR